MLQARAAELAGELGPGLHRGYHFFDDSGVGEASERRGIRAPHPGRTPRGGGGLLPPAAGAGSQVPAPVRAHALTSKCLARWWTRPRAALQKYSESRG